MKKSPQQEKLEAMLRSSKFSSCGFMGDDERNLWEIIDADAAYIEKLGKTTTAIAERMEELTQQAIPGLGDWVQINNDLKVCVDDTRGMIPCPWSHGVQCSKRITSAFRIDINKKIRWSDLNIHLIRAHGFFEGKGARFRIEPELLIKIIF